MAGNLLSKLEETRIAAESDLEVFIKLIHPQRVLGAVHRELIHWWTREEASNYQIVLLPRDHQKSAMIAYRVAWEITRDPTIRVLYISSTANLAIKQLKFIKDILTSRIYKLYWPDMVNDDEGRREKWTESEISVDDPRRKDEAVRDPTVFTAGLTTSITGLHCDIAVLDDIVVGENAFTEEGRSKVKTQYSYLSSIEGSNAKEWIVGTRYHPRDLYNDLLEMEVISYDKDGNTNASKRLYEDFTRQVEDIGDGSGEFLWPRQRRQDGKWFGFDRSILEEKRTKYIDKVQFRAQYYNDPNDPAGAGIDRSCFQYYDRSRLTNVDGKWYIRGNRVNLFAAMDFAFSLAKRADYTAIVVVAIDAEHHYYIVDIDRFKGDKISDYFTHLVRLHQKWGFRKLRAEVTVAQAAIVNSLKELIIREGLYLAIEDDRPSKLTGTKEERIEVILQPRYQARAIWHYQGGNCSILEEELILEHPPHDDVKDCLAAAIDSAIAPPRGSKMESVWNLITPHKFGGIA